MESLSQVSVISVSCGQAHTMALTEAGVSAALCKFFLKFVPKGLFDNKSSLVQVIDWCQKGDKLLPEPMMIIFYDISPGHNR